MTSSVRSKFVVLAILDGWGIASKGPGNAITQADTPNINRLYASYPHTQLRASGQEVGLPRGEDGNTETGHLNLGAGRIVFQELERVNIAIADGTFFEKSVFKGAVSHVSKNNSKLHLMGLIGAGGVHSNIEHLFALIHFAKVQKVEKLYLHLFTDGRDSPPKSAATYVNMVQKVIRKDGIGKIASIMGRYWAMDRDRRWDRTARAYFALTKGRGKLVRSPLEAIKLSYAHGKTDEFIFPYLITDGSSPLATIGDNDAVIFYNFRIDRPRQLAYAFALKDFGKIEDDIDLDQYRYMFGKDGEKEREPVDVGLFDRGRPLKNLYFGTMTEYSKALTTDGTHPAFPPEKVKMPVGHAISLAGKRQLRMTESEKERFVTFYFNGLHDRAFPEEDKIIIPSPRVPTYDQKPEMSADKLTDTLLKQLKKLLYDFIVVNYPNADMVGHTGNVGAAVTAIEKVDECVGKIANFALAYGGTLLVTADHGNVEEMINNQTGQIDTEHSTNPVPFIAISKPMLGKPQKLMSGILADVAPTVLKLLGIRKPSEMTGRDLLQEVKL